MEKKVFVAVFTAFSFISLHWRLLLTARASPSGKVMWACLECVAFSLWPLETLPRGTWT